MRFLAKKFFNPSYFTLKLCAMDSLSFQIDNTRVQGKQQQPAGSTFPPETTAATPPPPSRPAGGTTNSFAGEFICRIVIFCYRYNSVKVLVNCIRLSS